MRKGLYLILSIIILIIWEIIFPGEGVGSFTTSIEKNDHGEHGITYTEFHQNNTLENELAFDYPTSIMYACLVHVGKTSGSMTRCVLDLDVPSCPKSSPRAKTYEAVRHASKLGQIFLKKPPPHRWGTPFVRHIMDNYCYEGSTDLLVVTTRNPISRIKSSFEYERCDISNPTCSKEKQSIYLECYYEFEDLASTGLNEFYNSLNNMSMIPKYPSEMTCAQRAWSYVSGNRFFWEYNHHWYNYEYYFYGMLQHTGKCWGIDSSTLAKNPLLEPIDLAKQIHSHIGQTNHTVGTKCPRVMALRQEHLAHDWDEIDIMLGGNGAVGSDVFNKDHINEANDHVKTHNNSALSTEYLEVMCRALCIEIQYYKLTLWLSTNLNEEDVDKSMEDLRHQCPAEPSALRQCNTSSTPEPTVGQYKSGKDGIGTGIGKLRLTG